MKILIREYLNLQNITIDMSPPEGLTEFYGPHVSGVSCIIGKNGSGKSNILEYIVGHHNNANDLSLIYHAPIINQRKIKANTVNFYDCSERHKLEQFYKNFIDINYTDSLLAKKGLDSIESDYNLIILWSLLYQIYILSDNEAKNIYAQLKIRINFNDTDLFNKFNLLAKLVDPTNVLIVKYLESPSNYLKKITLHLITNLNEKLKRLETLFPATHSFKKDFDLEDYLQSNYAILSNQNKDKEFKFIDDIVNNYLNYLKNQKEYLDIFNIIEYFKKHKIKSEEDIVKNKNQELKMLLEYLINTENDKIEILYKTTNSAFVFSSGDTAYFSFLGRILFELNRLVAEGRYKFLLLLDEVDVALHPKRQKALFKKIIDNVNRLGEHIFKTKNVKLDIKILLTSHSPFLASDVPLKNIVYLDEKGLDTYNSPYTFQRKDIENSFASNIHMLYKNSFYLENGLIGDFAVDKIEQEIIPYLIESSSKGDVNKTNLLNHIKLVGDPILHRKMLVEYIRLYGTDDSSKLEIIELIEFLQNKLK